MKSKPTPPAVFSADGDGVLATNVVDDLAIERSLENGNVTDQEASGDQASDPFQTASSHHNRLEEDTPLRVGRVLLALPYVHCYKVQLSGRTVACVATALTHTAMTPTGVRSIETIPPNSQVVIWQPKGAKLAYIVGVIPVATMADKLNISDHIQQAGNSGPKKVESVRTIPKSVEDAFGWVPQSSGRPMDGTHGEWGRFAETGVGVFIDTFQAYLRVNEVCGLWLNYFDNYAKLAALSLNVMSYCENVMQTYDEGENFSLVGHCTFPWEATGMYRSGDKFSETNDKKQVQLDKQFPFAEEDIEDLSQTPVYRLTDYTGYLGQGWNRTLMLPAAESGKRLMTDTDNDTGLFNEFLSLDGAYSLRSAKSVFIAKYPLIPNPRRVRSPEDAKGDDLMGLDDYRFSGKFGKGDAHKSFEWDTSDVKDLRNLMKPAGILDMIAHHYNWKSTFPFYYHKKDYRYPQENDSGSAFQNVSFYVGNFSEAYVELGGSTRLKISDAYGEVEYYNTASFFTLTDDGSVLIGDGYGSQITMTGGQIRLEAGGDVMLMSNSRVVTLAREAITRTKDSIDISSSDKDIRIRSKNNLQVSGGALLLEATNTGSHQIYKDRVGEFVQAAGITLLSKGGSVNLLTKDYYLRTGILDAPVYGSGSLSLGRVITKAADGTGDVVIDVAKGRGRYLNYAAQQDFYTGGHLGIWHSPRGGNVNDSPSKQIDKCHYFSPIFSAISGPTVNDSHFLTCNEGHIASSASVYATQHMQCVENLGCRDGVKGVTATNKTATSDFPASLKKFIDEFCEYINDSLIEQGRTIFDDAFKDRWWQENQPGNDSLLENEIGFSYRDMSEIQQKAYGYSPEKFFLLETRYQQLERTNLAGGGSQAWKEDPVLYQGKELYPWPGKINWEDNDTLLRYKNPPAGGGFAFRLFNPAGHAQDRETFQEDYEEPKFEDWDRKTPASEYKM
jgi:hypothetical protein